MTSCGQRSGFVSGDELEGVAPCQIVIFGASGDLTSRKLVPSLFDLFCSGSLPEKFQIIGVARTPMDNAAFREVLRYRCEKSVREPDRWHDFSSRLLYRQVFYDDPNSFVALHRFLQEADPARDLAGNRLFYLATPPSLYPPVATGLGENGLISQQEAGGGWTRIVVEKPFGRDLATAMELNATLRRYFREEQIFRIDHYLAKETVQDILLFRFANAIFEPVWNRSYIDYVGIMAAESLGVGHRAGYYEQAGVLRDMFQNHMMQLLSIVAMEPPSAFRADLVRNEKIKVFQALKPLVEEQAASPLQNILLGQYTAGTVHGRGVPAYRDEEGVSPVSVTPTFAMLTTFVDNWRWRGVPFYICSGKGLREKITRIVVQFKDVPHSLFQESIGRSALGNRLAFSIFPDEEIELTFQAKRPGSRLCLRTVTMNYRYAEQEDARTDAAYGKVLLDCILGNQTLFWSQSGLEQTWKYLTPILEACESCGDQGRMLAFYPAGSWGPDRALPFMEKIL